MMAEDLTDVKAYALKRNFSQGDELNGKVLNEI